MPPPSDRRCPRLQEPTGGAYDTQRTRSATRIRSPERSWPSGPITSRGPADWMLGSVRHFVGGRPRASRTRLSWPRSPPGRPSYLKAPGAASMRPSCAPASPISRSGSTPRLPPRKARSPSTVSAGSATPYLGRRRRCPTASRRRALGPVARLGSDPARLHQRAARPPIAVKPSVIAPPGRAEWIRGSGRGTVALVGDRGAGLSGRGPIFTGGAIDVDDPLLNAVDRHLRLDRKRGSVAQARSPGGGRQ